MANEQEHKEPINQEQPIAAEATSLANFGNNTQSGGDAQRIAELERELQQERVEKGRLRQTNDELRQLKEEVNRLKAENSSLKQRKPSDYLSEAEREQLDDVQLAVIDKVVRGRVGDMSEAQRAENEQLRAELAKRDANMAASAAAQFNAEVERLAPGLTAAISERKEDWMKWVGSPRRSASVAAAFKSYDAATVAEFLQEFAQAKGIQANWNGTAARPNSSFSPRGGNHPVSRGGDSTIYTVEQYSKELRKASDDFDAGRITQDEYRAITKKFDTALSEGRIVRQ